MTLLITGGTGFIGSRLALRVRREGLAVTITGALNTPQETARCRELAAAGVSIIPGKLQDAEFVRGIVKGATRIIHLAAAQHEANVPNEYFHDVNVRGTRALLEACVDAGVRQFVYGSTIGVYGSAAAGRLDENTPPRPDNIYGRTKLAAEGVVREFLPRLATTIVRISETYGPGDFRLLKLFRAIARGTFLMIGSGDNRRQVIHVDDLVQGLLLASTHPVAPGETFVLAGQEVMTTAEMVAHVAHAMGKQPPRFKIPLWPLLATAVVMERTLQPLGIQPPLHRRRLDFFRKSFVFATDKAQGLLGFRPMIPFDRGVADTLNWYVREGFLDHSILPSPPLPRSSC